MRPIVTAVVCLVALLSAAATANAAAIVDLPVAFEVRNTNSSGVHCPSDEEAYTLRGHLVAPRSALERTDVVTIYVHGFNSGEWNYRFPLAGYDFAVEMAKLGHASLTVDRLGFDASGHPYGFMSCFGAHADVIHQVITELRTGTSAVQGQLPLAFETIVLSGHDLGGTVAEIEAYSYKDVDGLMVMNIADGPDGYPVDPSVISFADALERCGAGGEPAEPGGPDGYARYFRSDDDVRKNGFRNSEPAVTDLALKLVNKNPCGEYASLVPAFNVNSKRVRDIHVPILLLYSDLDFNKFAGAPAEEQRSLYTGSDDVSLVTMQNTGHFPMLDRNAPLFRSIVSDWLNRHGFGGQVEATRRLRLAVRPRRARRGARTRFAFRLTEAAVESGAARTAPVAQATVRFAGKRAVTDRFGRAAIVATLRSPGRHRASAGMPGLPPAAATVTVAAPGRG